MCKQTRERDRESLHLICMQMCVCEQARELESLYLVLLGDVLLVVLLHLSELGLQASELVLHLHHVLQVPLCPLVQDLDGLGHVLHLQTHKVKVTLCLL